MSAYTIAATVDDHATRYTHQRKFAILPDLKILAIREADSTKFVWFTTGTGFTDYGADILGALDVSFVPIHIGSTWYLVATWVQWGTSGGRTNLAQYVMLGSLSTDQKTLSWGAAQLSSSGGYTDLPDVDVIADGSGALGLHVWHYDDGAGNSYAIGRKFTISAAGVLALDTAQFTVGGPYTGTSVFPSVAFADTKDVGVLWDGGALGIRFRKGTYASGSLSWLNPERPFDPYKRMVSAENPAASTVSLRYDVKYHVWLGMGPSLIYIPTGVPQGATSWRDLADVSGGTVTGAIGLAVGTARGGSGAVDPISGDIFYGYASAAGAQWIRFTRTGLDTAGLDAGTGLNLFEAPTGNEKNTVIAIETGLLHVLWNDPVADVVKYGRAAINLAPNAASLVSPTGGGSINATQTQRFTWRFLDPIGTDTQSAFNLRYKVVGTNTWTTIGKTLSASSTWDAAPGLFVVGSDYEWQVLTYDALGKQALSWSPSGTFTAAAPGTGLAITFPPNNSEVDAVEIVDWNVSDADGYQIRTVADSSGTPNESIVYYDSGEQDDPSLRSALATFAVSGRTEHLGVRTILDGIWTDWEYVLVRVSYVLPGQVEGRVEYGDGYADIYAINHAGQADVLVPPVVDATQRIDAGNPAGGDY